MTLTKERIIEGIQKDTNQKKAEIQRTVESLLEIMKQTLASGEDIMVQRFREILRQGKESEERKESPNRRVN